MSHIIVAKHALLQREDPITYTQICKLVFKKYFKSSLAYCSPLILSDLLRVAQNKGDRSTGLHFFQRKLFELFKSQREQMQTSKRLVYDRISKFFPFDQPFYL